MDKRAKFNREYSDNDIRNLLEQEGFRSRQERDKYKRLSVFLDNNATLVACSENLLLKETFYGGASFSAYHYSGSTIFILYNNETGTTNVSVGSDNSRIKSEIQSTLERIAAGLH